MKRFIFFSLIIGCAAMLLAQKSVYVWTDRQGVAHVSDRKPDNEPNVREMKSEAGPDKLEPDRNQEKDDSSVRAYEEEKAKKAEEYEKGRKEADIARKQKDYEKLRAEEKQFLELNEKAQNPFAYNYSVQKLNAIQQEKQKLEDALKSEKGAGSRAPGAGSKAPEAGSR